MCVCARAREVVIEADNGEIRPLTLSALTRTCDDAQASSAVSATHPGDGLMTADGGQTPPLPRKHRRRADARSLCFVAAADSTPLHPATLAIRAPRIRHLQRHSRFCFLRLKFEVLLESELSPT